nr:hypothetical protein [Vibrio parahaemolyticus]
MQLRKLDYSFYQENSHLEQTLDGDGRGKTRGYGILVIEIEGAVGTTKWGIPLHSNLQNRACFQLDTVEYDGKTFRTGLNYSKALLLKKDSYVSNAIYQIPVEQKDAISKSEKAIAEDFKKYVEKYIKAAMKDDNRVLNNREYRFSTLKNYNVELGIDKEK